MIYFVGEVEETCHYIPFHGQTLLLEDRELGVEENLLEVAESGEFKLLEWWLLGKERDISRLLYHPKGRSRARTRPIMSGSNLIPAEQTTPNINKVTSMSAQPPPFLLSVISGTETAQLATRPRVTLTYAQSLDGCIAGVGGQQLILSGKESMNMTHWCSLSFTMLGMCIYFMS